MHFRTRHRRGFSLQILAALMALALSAAHARAQEDNKGVLLSFSFGGSADQAGRVLKLDDAVGYRFGEHFQAIAGLPFYFVKASASDTTLGTGSHYGIGNAYLDLRLSAGGSGWFYSSTIRGTAPTGDAAYGFSTGRATVDWTNYLERSIGRFAPFGSGGLANTISDTHFFYRPFSSLGLVGHLEGGANVELFPIVSIGGSGYAVIPKGQQKVYSQLVPAGSAKNANKGSGKGSGKNKGKGPTYETESVTIGSADTARDHGLSAWLDVRPSAGVALQVGYSRSMRFAYNAVFFSIGFDVARLIRAAGK